MNRLLLQLTVAAVLACFCLQPVTAQITESGKKPEAKPKLNAAGNPIRKVKPGLLRERTYKRLNNIYKAIGEERYAEALEGLKKLWPSTERFPYERAVLAQAMAHTHAAMENYDEALKYFKMAVELDTLPNLQHFQVMFGVAQLHAVKQQYEETIRWLKRWFAEVDTPPTADAYVLLGNAYAQLGKYRQAIDALNHAIRLAEKPKESWYQLLMAMHYELKEYDQAAHYLEILVRMNPAKKEYWTQLASMYMNVKKDQDALAVMALAHLQSLLEKEGDYKQLYSLYGYLKVPYKAAQVLEEGLRKGIVKADRQNWESVANAWYAAHEMEKALQAFGEASKYADNGKIDMRRAYILVDQERWQEAIEALQSALEKGGIKEYERGNAWLMLGMAQFELDRLTQAEKAFRQARKIKKARKSANQWLKHLQEERKRREKARQAEA